ncbi:adenylylsulfate kinase [Burkholderiales bacterium]|nr:adenylylsulfate kinase [Burkholderiales bacterium]
MNELFDGRRHGLPAAFAAVSAESHPLARNEHAVDRRARVDRNGHEGAVVWLTGLSGSGKTTLAMALERSLFGRGCEAYVLDGDNLRHGLNSDLGFSPEDRSENIRRVGEVAALFADAGVICIVALISPYRADRARARAAVKNGKFIEVHVAASVDICETRDPRGLYKLARSGKLKHFTGIDAPYEEPITPEVIVNTDREDPADSLHVIEAIVRRAILREEERL